MNVRVEVDAADVRFTWTDQEPGEDGLRAYAVFPTLGEAKEYALRLAIPERESWANCVRVIRAATKDDVL